MTQPRVTLTDTRGGALMRVKTRQNRMNWADPARLCRAAGVRVPVVKIEQPSALRGVIAVLMVLYALR
jgi:hypothetical protein